MIIDFHTHTFPDRIAPKTIPHLASLSHSKAWTDGTTSDLLSSMKAAGVDYSINLPVLTNTAQATKVNQNLADHLKALQNLGIISFGGMHPDCKNYKELLTWLSEAGFKGIKLHPAYQSVDFNDSRNMRIVEKATELGLIVLIHAGLDIGIPGHNYSSIPMILEVLDKVKPDKLVLAHMGNWQEWNDTEKYLAGAPCYFDTAFSLGAITANPGEEDLERYHTNLCPEDFVRLCRKHGTDKILFATDSPWEDQSEYLRRMDSLPFTNEEKMQILGENARKLLGM